MACGRLIQFLNAINQYIENIMENFGFQDIDTNYGQGNYDNWVEDRFDEGILYYNYRF